MSREPLSPYLTDPFLRELIPTRPSPPGVDGRTVDPLTTLIREEPPRNPEGVRPYTGQGPTACWLSSLETEAHDEDGPTLTVVA